MCLPGRSGSGRAIHWFAGGQASIAFCPAPSRMGVEPGYRAWAVALLQLPVARGKECRAARAAGTLADLAGAGCATGGRGWPAL